MVISQEAISVCVRSCAFIRSLLPVFLKTLTRFLILILLLSRVFCPPSVPVSLLQVPEDFKKTESLAAHS